MNASVIGLSALTTGQRGLDLVGQNIANASTTGYHRQSLLLAAQVDDGIHGDGVTVQSVIRAADELLQRGILTATADAASSNSQIGLETQVENNLTAAGVDRQVTALFNQIVQWSAQPDDLTSRRTVLSAASTLANSLNQLSGSLSQLRADTGKSIASTVDDINQKASQIAVLNQQISAAVSSGQNPNDLLDRRDQLIADLSKQIDIRVVPQDHGLVTITAANAAILAGTTVLKLTASTDNSGNSVIYGADSNQPLTVHSGALAGLLQERNQALPSYLSQINDFSANLIRSFDELQATGLGANGPQSLMNGTRAVNDATVPLSQSGLAFPVQAGTLYLGINHTSTGQRTLTAINIDPATQSLQDVASAITAASSGLVQATVMSGGTLQLQSAAGYTFDFTGQFPSSPDNVVMNGTSVPQVTGTYTGSGNDTYSFKVVGNGTVGVTPGLSLEVRDGSGKLLNALNVGAGYTPGTQLSVGNGVRVQLSAGTTNNGTFSVPVVAQPDTAGLLSALGVNTFFTGTDATTIAVNSNLTANPAGLSASLTNQAGDTQNIQRFAALQDKPLLTGGTRSMPQFLADLAGQLGENIQSLKSQNDSQQHLQSGLQQQDQSVVGVDVNEEMIKLLDYQRMIESGTKYLSVVNTTMDSILTMIQ